MATEIKIWEIEDQKISPVEDTSLAAQHLENELETWITQAPNILGDDLLIIDRQRDIPGVGRLDLLCIEATGKLVVVELKRDKSARDTVAQALDYASWLNDAGLEEILEHAKEYLHAELSEEFEKHFGVDDMPDILPQNHRVVIVAARLDNSAERIVNYLRERYGVEFNVLLFKYARLAGGREVLVRTLLLPESTRVPVGTRQRQATVDDLIALARDRHIEDLVEDCRGVKGMWGEQPRNTYGGSFRYWATRKDGGYNMVFGVNVAGTLAQAPSAKLDVWVRAHVLSQVTDVPEENIRKELQKSYSVVKEDNDACVVRLSNRDEAGSLVKQLKEWAQGNQAQTVA
jgi:hypothetical protein